MRISAFRNRLRVDVTSRDGITELLNGANPFFWNGGAVQFEVGLFVKTVIVDDVSNIASISIEIKNEADLTGAALMSATIPQLDIKGDLTQLLWDGGLEDDCHAKVFFDSADAELELGAQTSVKFWMVITAIRNDGERIILGCAEVTVQEDGSTAPSASIGGANFRYNQGYPEMKFSDTTWHRLAPAFSQGQYTLDITQAAAGQSSDGNSDHFRLNGGFPELLFPDASWHQLTPKFDQGIYTLDVKQAAAGGFVSNADHFRINFGFAELLFPDATWHRLDPVFDQGQYILNVLQQAS